jgi:GNAT superfamily N-acetyltransferase
MLLSGSVVVTGGDSVAAGFAVRAVSGPLAVVAVVGHPAPDAIVGAVDDVTDMTPVIAQSGNAAYVSQVLSSCPPSGAGHEWRPERAVLHRLTFTSIADVPDDDVPVRLLKGDDPLDHLPAGLRFEMSHARERADVAVAVIDGRPVSFCYACWITETLWDVSIDTLEAYRRRGLAARTVRYMIRRMREDGREPVWGAVESNAASLELARKLGFTPVDEVVVFSRGPWAYLTRGFDEQVA